MQHALVHTQLFALNFIVSHSAKAHTYTRTHDDEPQTFSKWLQKWENVKSLADINSWLVSGSCEKTSNRAKKKTITKMDENSLPTANIERKICGIKAKVMRCSSIGETTKSKRFVKLLNRQFGRLIIQRASTKTFGKSVFLVHSNIQLRNVFCPEIRQKWAKMIFSSFRLNLNEKGSAHSLRVCIWVPAHRRSTRNQDYSFTFAITLVCSLSSHRFSARSVIFFLGKRKAFHHQLFNWMQQKWFSKCKSF